MSDVMGEFRDAVRRTVLTKGELCSEREHWTYGWQEWDWQHEEAQENRECSGWIAGEDSEVIEYSFSEFVDTFSGNADKTVLALSGVSCGCGKYKDRTIGYEGTTGDLLQALLEDSLGVRKEYRW